MNHKRVERIWRQEGLKVPRSSPSAGGCGSTMAPASGCGRSTRTTSGAMTSWQTARTMAAAADADVIDEYTRECLAIEWRGG